MVLLETVEEPVESDTPWRLYWAEKLTRVAQSVQFGGLCV